MTITSLLVASVAISLAAQSYASPTGPPFLREAALLPKRGVFEDGVVTLPLVRRRAKLGAAQKKRQTMSQVPVIDYVDQIYNVALEIGGQPVAVAIDSGSSDLWAITSDCKTSGGVTCSGFPDTLVYTPSESPTYNATGLDYNETYGSDSAPTFASGPVGFENVTFGGLTLPDQMFAAVNAISDNILIFGSSGILGVSFPYLSSLASEFADEALASENITTGQEFLSTYMSSMDKSAPFLNRLASAGELKEPMYTLTLQREEPTNTNSNIGVMTIGGLPSGVSNESLTWVPVNPYSINDTVIADLNTPISAEVQAEVLKLMPTIPFAWEAVIDGFFVNGQLASNSSGTKPIALFDSGTPTLKITSADLASPLLPKPDSNGMIPCNAITNFSIGIAGKQFPINPLDLVGGSSSTNCTPNIGTADPPSPQSLSSYLLGDPFFRSNLVAFYFGNITDQASDPARIGFLSTVDATEAEAVASSFWASAGTTYTFPTDSVNFQPATTSVANPVNSNAPKSSATATSSSTSSASRLVAKGWIGVTGMVAFRVLCAVFLTMI